MHATKMVDSFLRESVLPKSVFTKGALVSRRSQTIGDKTFAVTRMFAFWESAEKSLEQFIFIHNRINLKFGTTKIMISGEGASLRGKKI